MHVFLINVIRENRFRLFQTVPRIVNPSFCGAYPLFLHWVLALAGPRIIPFASLTLNATLNAALVAMTFLALHSALGPDDALRPIIGPTTLSLALLPQLYHALSARNFGISARPVGLVLFAATAFMSYAAESGHGAAWVGGILVAYAIWGTSTFGLQMLLLSGLIMGVVFQHWGLLALTAGGGGVFIVLHRGFALRYIQHTVLFSLTYARELAPLFILERRFSIWRDLVTDILATFRREPFMPAVRYAYENAVLIAVLLNVVALIAAYSLLVDSGTVLSGLPLFAAQLSATAVILFVATSFRRTRFLGEPERYLEMSAPFSVLAAMAFLQASGDGAVVWGLLMYFALATAAQFTIARMVRRAVAGRSGDLDTLSAAIDAHCPPGTTVRLAANNDETQKYFMTRPWSFVRFWSYEEPFAGYRVRSAFKPFPVLKTAVVEAAIRAYDANYCLMERGEDAAELFANDAVWRDRLLVLAETATTRLYAIAPAYDDPAPSQRV